MILLIDNFDSFSYNLYQMIGAITPQITIIRNNQRTVAEIESLEPDGIIISPGPGRPADAGVCEELIGRVTGKIPILGVCLGHQAICEAFGGVITYAKHLMHGKASGITLYESDLFAGLPDTMYVARYHSLAAQADTLPCCLRVTALANDGEIMAVQHRQYPVYGLQFHPESILTPLGKTILENFVHRLTIAQ
ncbi:MAG: aminodeoxychorismate/anthranilate synthase component II [Clostridiales bacterium]|jgi:anthranilate synthase component 2|nr:aminodeoxychorismate/anthranilate synthase component II [Clostridiales bacterium]